MPLDPDQLEIIRSCVRKSWNELTKVPEPVPCAELSASILHAANFLRTLDDWLADLVADPVCHGDQPCETCPSWRPPSA